VIHAFIIIAMGLCRTLSVLLTFPERDEMGDVIKLSETEIRSRLASLPGWSLEQGKLYREFRFADFVAAFGFMTRVAAVAEEMAHHPEWFNVYDVVRVHLSTHEVDGISDRDFQLAAAMNARVG
jgi:4a-hydroxytetrahydrobiopterin dehydratase